jgi:hypothetical protein
MTSSTRYPANANANTSPASRAAEAVRAVQSDRVIGIVGAVMVLVATGLSWYSRELSISVGGAVENFTSGITLWHVRSAAAWLLLIAALIGVVALVVPVVRERRGGVVAAIAGFGIIVYSVVASFDLPDLPSGALVGAHGAAAVGTALDVGSFVALIGGVLLVVGGIGASDDAVNAVGEVPR